MKKTYTISHLNIQINSKLIENVLVSFSNESKDSCTECTRKTRYLLLVDDTKICASCLVKKHSIEKKLVDRVYNYVYQFLQNPEKEQTPYVSRARKKTQYAGKASDVNSLTATQLRLTELYVKGWKQDDQHSMALFLKEFDALFKKYSKITSRDGDIEDNIQFFREKVIYYHRQELKKENPRFDYSKPENYGALVRATHEYVLQCINMLKSKKNAVRRKGDYETYTEITDCYKVQSGSRSIESQVSSKVMLEELNELMGRHLSDIAYSVYQVQLKGFIKNDEIASTLNINSNEVLSAKKEIMKAWKMDLFSNYRKELLSDY